MREYSRNRIQNKTEEVRKTRLEYLRQNHRKRMADETEEETAERLGIISSSMKRMRIAHQPDQQNLDNSTEIIPYS